MADEQDDTATITFRVREETKEELNRTIAQAKGAGILDLNTSRSSLLRQAVHEIIDDLEVRLEEADEGNREAVTAAAD